MSAARGRTKRTQGLPLGLRQSRSVLARLVLELITHEANARRQPGRPRDECAPHPQARKLRKSEHPGRNKEWNSQHCSLGALLSRRASADIRKRFGLDEPAICHQHRHEKWPGESARVELRVRIELGIRGPAGCRGNSEFARDVFEHVRSGRSLGGAAHIPSSWPAPPAVEYAATRVQ